MTVDTPEPTASAPSTPPVAARRPHERVHHGHTFVDDYEWLRAKDDPEVIAHLEAENAWTDAQTAHLAPLRERLFDEVKARTQETDLSVPVRRGQYWYYARTVEGKSYGISCRAPISSPDDWVPPKPDDGVDGEQVLLDSNAEAEGHGFFSVGGSDVSADGTAMAWSSDVVGDERYTLRIRDLSTGADSGVDVVENMSGGAVFSPDGRFVFYSTVDEAWRPDTVWRHEVGAAASADVKVFTEPDERYWVGVGLTRSRRYVVIGLGSKITSEVHLLDAADPTGPFRVVWPRVEGVEYDVEHAVVAGSDRLVITHNDGAQNFEVVDVAADDPLGERITIIAGSDETRIEGVDAFASHLVVSYRRDVLTRVGIIPIAASIATGSVGSASTLGRIEGYGAITELDFDEPLYSVGPSSNPEWAQPTVRLGFSSFVTPTTVLDYDVATGERRVLKRQPVLGGYRSELYEQAREWAVASDGQRVPISVVWRRDLVERGIPSPMELYGYGSYEASMDPGFSIPRLSLLDRGVVFAIAHVRGGGELGRTWYDDGKMLAKRNTFTDFVSAAEHLTATGWTAPDRLVAEGGSAGGLLMGAVANLAPQLFSGILAVVPFVDALTSILDPDLPLTVNSISGSGHLE